MLIILQLTELDTEKIDPNLFWDEKNLKSILISKRN